MMKKVLMLLLGAALILSMAGAVVADETSPGTNREELKPDTTETPSLNPENTGDNTTIVQLTVNEAYLVHIPSTVTLAQTGKTVDYVNVTKLVILANQSLNITVTSANGWKVIWTEEEDGQSDEPITAELKYNMTAESFKSDSETGKDTRNPIETIIFDTDKKDTYKTWAIMSARIPKANTATGDILTKLTFRLVDTIRYSGTYTDGLTFTVAFTELPATTST